jgi:hypothetical protein
MFGLHKFNLLLKYKYQCWDLRFLRRQILIFTESIVLPQYNLVENQLEKSSGSIMDNGLEDLLSVGLYDRLCGLVVRVLGYRSGGPGSIPGDT